MTHQSLNFLVPGIGPAGLPLPLPDAAQARPEGQRKRVYCYIDEFGDYAEDSPVLLDLFNQSRKYELGVIVAHQQFEQIPMGLQAALGNSG